MNSSSQLHVVINTATNSGGEALAALRYAQALANNGCAVTLLSKNITGASTNNKTMGGGTFGHALAPTHSNLLAELHVQYRFIAQLCKQKQIDLIHLHGMWSPLLAIAALVALREKIPLLISPHGCLEPWALKYKHLKKIIALKTYQGMLLRSAAMFVATAEQELASIRKLNLRQPVAIVPNGIDAGSTSKRNQQSKIKKLLFLSRVHPKKGILDLVNAWAEVRLPGWKIMIAGSDEENYRSKVERLIQKKGLESDFEFVGFVDGAEKQACFDEASIFILPTYSENFGIAIAEALANELPVITTTGAPWSDLVKHKCGWWVQPGVRGISGALTEAMDCDEDELIEMGKRGRKLVIEKYTWEKIGTTAFEVSSWLLNQSEPKPQSVKMYGE